MKTLVVSPSPHVSSEVSTQTLMGHVLLALLPALACTVVIYGFGALSLIAVSVVSCVVFEYLIQKVILKTKTSICDLSAVLTGVLLGFNLPSGLPYWMVIIGALVAIGIGKMSFGGLGRNIFNPALVGRVFLLLSFPVAMTSFPTPEFIMGTAQTDAFSGATALSYVKHALGEGVLMGDVMSGVSYVDLFLGSRSGSLGEIGVFALLIGFVYMLIKKVITWHIPVAVLGTMAVFSGILYAVDPSQFVNPLFQVLTGGAMLGAVFMATDYVSSPMNKRAMIYYGVGIGVITILIRTWGAYPEGISFAILIMNSVVPLLNKYIKPKRF